MLSNCCRYKSERAGLLMDYYWIIFYCFCTWHFYGTWASSLESSNNDAKQDGNATATTTKSSNINVTKPQTADGGEKMFAGIVVNDGVLARMTYVLLGLTFILVVYFGIKFWRIRRRRPNVRRYDVLTTQRAGTDIGIDSESEDELFDDAHAKLVRNTSDNASSTPKPTR